MMKDLLPFILTHEGISYIKDDALYILDRRKLPFEREYIVCKDYIEAARAISDMVTQGGGPLEVALNAFLLESRRNSNLDYVVKTLSSSRKTNTTMKESLYHLLDRVRKGDDAEEAVSSLFSYYDECYDRMSSLGSSLIKDGDGILTRCFAEHSFLLSVKKAQLSGKDVRVYVPETRPYLQGARLTISCLMEMGIRAFLITDAMMANLMNEKKITVYMTASDRYLKNGSIINKTGTLADAICAFFFKIPYYAFALKRSSNDDYEMEYRSGEEVKNIAGVRIANESCEALYPAFDFVDRSLISAVITPEGINE